MQKIVYLLFILGELSAHRVGLNLPIGKKSIINGWDTKDWQFYVQVETCRSQNDCYTCGGSMIRSKTVLTAAHCIMEGAYMYILAGDFTDAYSRKTEIDVTQHRVHENWRSSNAEQGGPYDIALLYLASAPRNRVTIDICSGMDYSNSDINVIGMGIIDRPNNRFAKTLQRVKLDETNRCQDNINTNIQICLTGNNQDSCGGDSGGPAFPQIDQVCLYGIVSYGSSDCNGWGVYTRVPAFKRWVNQYA